MPLASGDADHFVVGRKYNVFSNSYRKRGKGLKYLLKKDDCGMEFPASFASESPSYPALSERYRHFNS